MPEFWVSSGHHLAAVGGDGRLVVTDGLLLAWLARPELVPPPEACPAERALHADLRQTPRAPVAAARVAALADGDARENWAAFLGFRDRLIAAGTIEGAYLDIVRGGAAVAPIFLGQLVHLVLRNALDGCDDPFVLRAAELLWRPQRAAVRDGALVLSDADLAEDLEAAARQAPLAAMLGGGPEAGLEMMTEATAWRYWSRSDAHAMALPWGAEPRARRGLATAIATFLRHLVGIEATVEPLVSVSEVDLRWYVGLDAEATRLGDALWRGGQPAGLDRLVGLFRLDLGPGAPVEPGLAGHPVYVLMALGPERVLRLKPQNLVTGLPLRATAAMH